MKFHIPFPFFPVLLCCIIVAATSYVRSPDTVEYDLLITNARIIDGTGAGAYEGSLLIRDGIIAAIGPPGGVNRSAAEIVDAAGRVVAPGFIDPHAHGDPLATPRFDNALSMGVTTLCLGQDGTSPGGDNITDWMDRVDAAGTGPNIIHFTGHNTLRRLAGAPRRELNETEKYIGQMKTILSDAMDAGSFGLTTGLEYDHGRFAGMPELIALAGPVAGANGLVMSHMRSEDNDDIERSVDELLAQARGSGAAVHISHIKIVYANDSSRAEKILAVMHDAEREGVTITADLYPYTASFTGIAIVFPEWALPPHEYEEVKQTRRDELGEYIRGRVHRRNGPGATLFGTGPWAGMTLAEAADSLGKPFERVLIDDIGPNGASAAYFVMNEDVMRRFLKDGKVMVSSDGSPGMYHPRGYGSFAKIIRKYVREENLLTLEEAVHKMTGLPANTLGLYGSEQRQIKPPRGLIREGFAADLLIFDPDKVRDNATFEEPHRYAEGFDRVYVNGKAVIEGGKRNNRRPGRVLRKTNP